MTNITLADAIDLLQEAKKSDGFAHININYEMDFNRIKERDMVKLERMFTEDELTGLLVSYVVLKNAKGKKAKLSKFVKKMVA